MVMYSKPRLVETWRVLHIWLIQAYMAVAVSIL